MKIQCDRFEEVYPAENKPVYYSNLHKYAEIDLKLQKSNPVLFFCGCI